MSTVHRHSLKKANRPQRKQPQQESAKKSRSSTRSVARSARRLWRSRWLWIVVVVIIIFIGLGSWYYGTRGAAASSPVKTASSHVQTAPTAVPTWQTVRTFNGSSTGDSTQKTQKFTTTGNWQISWACQGINGVDDWLYIAIYNADGTLYNAGAQVTCIAAKQVVGSVQEAKAGEFYLTVDANTAWTITVQQEK